MTDAPMGSLLAHWAGHRLSMRCLACGWACTAPAEALIERFGPRQVASETPARLARLDGCRKTGCAVGFVNVERMPPAKPPIPTPETIGKSDVLMVNDLREWHVVLAQCPCGHRARIDMQAMMPRLKRGRMVMASQFRCTRCGNRDGNRFSVRMMPR